MTDNANAIHAALQNLPRFAGRPQSSYTTTRLGGITNLVSG